MAFINRQEVTFTIGPAVSTVTVPVAAFTLANLALVSLSWRADGTATNNWDSQVTAEPLPGTSEWRITRAGNGGTVTGRLVFVEDDRASTQHVKSTSLAGGANNFPVSSSAQASSYINPLGMKAQGNRDDDTSIRLTQTSDTNVLGQMTAAPSGEEVNFLLVQFTGCSVQQGTQQSNDSVSIPISSTFVGNSITFVTEVVTFTSTWRNDEIDTYDLLDPSNLRVRRFLNSGANECNRGWQVIELPSYITVQRGTASPTAPFSSQAYAVSSVAEARSVAKGQGAPDGNANHAEATGTNSNQQRATFETEQTSPTQVTQRRTVSSGNAILAFELATFGDDVPPASGTHKGTPRRWRNGISRRAMCGVAA